MKLTDIKGVGPKTINSLNTLGIYTAEDLLYYFPRDYEDRNIKDINCCEIKDGDYISTIGIVNLILPYRRGYYGKGLCRIIFKCNNKLITCVWFNKPYITKSYKIGEKYYLYGKTKIITGQIQITEPECEKVKGKDLPQNNIMPIYPLNKNINQKNCRR